MKLLAFTRYGRLGASSRTRSIQFSPFVEGAGLSFVLQPLLSDDYLRAKYSGAFSAGHVLAGYWRRLIAFANLPEPSVFWIEKELLPWAPFVLERLILRRDRRWVIDFDDAIFHNYDLHASWFVRWVLGSKIDRLMSRADLVVVGNSYLGDRARAAGARRVEWVPTVVDLDRYPEPAPRASVARRLRVGWIGSPATDHYLAVIGDAVAFLKTRHDVEFVAIGARADAAAAAGFVALPWTEDTEVSNLHSFDIGVMPLIDGPWERGKCGYKLIQYMACGLPVVASPVGVNVDIVREGENGFSATSRDEWVAALDRLLSDAELRHGLGQAGRRDVENTYCLQVQGPRLVKMLKSLGAR